MKIVICEDNKNDSALLLSFLERYKKDRQLDIEVTLYKSGEALLHDMGTRDFHLVFMDVGLLGINGVETAKRIREVDMDCAIIFTTTSPEYAVQSYAVRAVHYLLKPVAYEAFTEAMQRCEKQMEQFSRYIEVIENRLPVRVLLRDILFVEVFRKSCIIQTIKRDISTYLSIEELEKLIDSDAFLRCHRSYIVNLNRVTEMHKEEFVLEGGKRALISRRMQQTVQNAYYSYARAQAQIE